MSGWKHAFALSKADVLDATPPGTIQTTGINTLNEKALEAGEGQSTASASSSEGTVRFPTPSSDPADPLNWPMWRKTAILLVSAFYAFLGNFQSASIGPALQFWPSTHPDDAARPVSALSKFIAVNVLFLGASNMWFVPLAQMFGRRPVLLVAVLIMTVSSVWAAVAHNYESTLAARIFMGIGGAPSETIAPMLVGEVFFVHERGRAMAIYTAFLSLGPVVGGIAGGYIAGHHGWAAIFWVCTGLSAALLVLTLFLVPETQYQRQEQPVVSDGDAIEQQPSVVKDGSVNVVEDGNLRPSPPQQHRPYTFARSLGFGPIRGGMLTAFVRPWRTLAFPATWVVMSHYAGLVGGIVTISTMGAQLMAAPPYSWGANAGLINVGALIGTLVGMVYTYLTADAMQRVAQRGKTHIEPESRLLTMFPTLVIATLAFFVFGFCAQYPGGSRWVGLQVGFGMLSMGLMQIPSIGFNYVIDCYGHLAGDCFVMITILRSIVAFAWTFFVSGWVHDRGAAEPFGIFGMLMGLFSLLTIPLWMFGKRMRIATAGAVWMKE